MKPRKRSKPRVWRVWVGFYQGDPDLVWNASYVAELRASGRDIRQCEIREVPKRRKARRKP